MSTKVTIKGQATLPKAVSEAAEICPGDRMTVRARPEGGIVVEQEASAEADALRTARGRVEKALNLLDQRGIKFSMTTDEWRELMRADD